MTNRTALLLAVSVAALGVAAYLLFVRGDPETRLSDDPADAVHFLCTRDGHSFSLTLQAVQDAFRTGDAAAGRRGARTPLVARCPQCTEMTAYRAGRCPVCDARRLGFQPCPKCNAPGIGPAPTP